MRISFSFGLGLDFVSSVRILFCWMCFVRAFYSSKAIRSRVKFPKIAIVIDWPLRIISMQKRGSTYNFLQVSLDFFHSFCFFAVAFGSQKHSKLNRIGFIVSPDICCLVINQFYATFLNHSFRRVQKEKSNYSTTRRKSVETEYYLSPFSTMIHFKNCPISKFESF